MTEFMTLLMEAGESWKNPPAPPKQASPVEIKRVLFIRIPKYKNDLKKALKKLAAAKTPGAESKAKDNVEVKKGKLDFALARLSGLLNYAAENTLQNPKVSDEIKDEVRRLIGKSAPVFSDAEAFAAEAASVAGLPTEPLHGAFAGSFDAMISGDPDAFAGDVSLPKKAIPYEFEPPKAATTSTSEPETEKPAPEDPTPPEVKSPPPPPPLPKQPLKTFTAAQKAQVKGLVKAAMLQAAKKGSFAWDDDAVKAEAMKLGDFDETWLGLQISSMESDLWVKDLSDLQKQGVSFFAKKLVEADPSLPLVALAEALVVGVAVKHGFFPTMGNAVSMITKAYAEWKKTPKPFKELNIGEKNKVLALTKMAAVANAWAVTLVELGGKDYGDQTKSAAMVAADLAKADIYVKEDDIWELLEKSVGVATEVVSGPAFNSLKAIADKQYTSMKAQGQTPTPLALAQAMMLGSNHTNAESVEKIFDELVKEHGDKTDYAGWLKALEAKIKGWPKGKMIPHIIYEVQEEMGEEWDKLCGQYGMPIKVNEQQDIAPSYLTDIDNILEGEIKARADLPAAEKYVNDWFEAQFKTGVVDFGLISKLIEPMIGQLNWLGLWEDTFQVLKDEAGTTSLKFWVAKIFLGWRNKKQTIAAKDLPPPVLKKVLAGDIEFFGTNGTKILADAKALQANTLKQYADEATAYLEQLSYSPAIGEAFAHMKGKFPSVSLADAFSIIGKAKALKWAADLVSIDPTATYTDSEYSALADSFAMETEELKKLHQGALLANDLLTPSPVASADSNPVTTAPAVVDISTLTPPKNKSLGYTKKELQSVHTEFLKEAAVELFVAKPWATQFLPPTDNKYNFMVKEFRFKFEQKFGWPIKLAVAHELLKKYHAEHKSTPVAKAVTPASVGPAPAPAKASLGLDDVALDKLFDVNWTPDDFGEIPTSFGMSKGGGVKSGGKALLSDGVTMAMWKKNSVAAVNYAEVAANRLQAALGLHSSPTILHKNGSQLGILVKYPKEQETAILGDDTMTGNQWAGSTTYPKSLQKALVLDMLTFNNDSHPGNFIKLPNGELKHIDLGQAMKFFKPNTHIDLDHKVIGGSSGSSPKGIPHRMMIAWSKGDPVSLTSLSDPDLKGLLDKIESIPSAAYKKLWTPYANGMNKDSKWLDQVDEHRKRIRFDVGRMYLQAALRRAAKTGEDAASLINSVGAATTLAGHITGDGSYALALAGDSAAKTKVTAALKAALSNAGSEWQVEGKHIAQHLLDVLGAAPEQAPKEPEPAAVGDPNEILPTSKPPTVAKLKERGGMGVQQFFAGAGAKGHVEKGRVSVFRSKDGRVFARMILSKKGRAVLEPKLPGGSGGPPQPELQEGPIALKLKNFHNTVHFEAALPKLEQYLKDEAGWESGLTSVRKFYKQTGEMMNDPDPEIAKMAKHYWEQLDKFILKVPSTTEGVGGIKWKLDPNVPPENRKIEPYVPDGLEAEKEEMKKLHAKAVEDWKAEQAKAGKNSIVTNKVNYFPVFNVSADVAQTSTPEAMTYSKEITSKGGFAQGKLSGKGHIIDLGDGFQAAYMATDDNRRSRQGNLLLEFPANTSDAQIKEGFDRLSSLGLDVKEATRADTELEYLRETAWLMRRAGEDEKGVNGEVTDLHQLEPDGMSSEELVAWYKAELSKPVEMYKKTYSSHNKVTKPSMGSGFVNTGGVGSDITKMGGYDPIPKDFGGYLCFRKVDADDATMQRLEDFVLTNGASNTGSAVMPLLTGNFLSFEARSQRGAPTPGMSNPEDTSTGGANFTYWRLRKRGTGDNLNVTIDAKRLAYTGAYGTETDSYGAQFAMNYSQDPRNRPINIAEDVVEHLDNWGSITEVMIEDGVHIDSWLDNAKFGSKWNKELKAKLKSAGIDKINGMPVDSVIG